MAKQNLQAPATEVFPRTMATSGTQQKRADFSDAPSSRSYKTNPWLPAQSFWVNTALAKIKESGVLQPDKRGKHKVRPHRLFQVLQKV
nr:unnamed protein product [Callosobruchus chinensis]